MNCVPGYERKARVTQLILVTHGQFIQTVDFGVNKQMHGCVLGVMNVVVMEG